MDSRWSPCRRCRPCLGKRLSWVALLDKVVTCLGKRLLQVVLQLVTCLGKFLLQVVLHNTHGLVTCLAKPRTGSVTASYLFGQTPRSPQQSSVIGGQGSTFQFLISLPAYIFIFGISHSHSHNSKNKS